MFYLSFHSAFCLFLVITHLFSLSLFFVNSLNCIFLKCLEFFDIRDYSFKLCVLGILFGEHFYRNGGFFFGGGYYLDLSYCLCFCNETWVCEFLLLVLGLI